MARHHSRPSSVRLDVERLESREVPAALNTPIPVANAVVGEPASAINSQGTRVVVWAQQNNVFDADVWAQRFRPNGDKLGAPIRVTTTGDFEAEPDVAIDFAGNFYVSYTHFTVASAQIEIRRYTAAGIPVERAVIAPANVFFTHSDSHIACSADGRAVVSYTEQSIFGDQNVLARMYQRNRLLLQRPDIRVADSPALVEADSDIARVAQVLPGNRASFAIVYTVNGVDVFARRYDDAGNLLNPNNPALPMATRPLFVEANPSIAVNTVGQFAVAWQQQGVLFVDTDIAVRSFNSTLVPVLGRARELVTAGVIETNPSVGIRNNGRIVVGYTSQQPGVFNFRINVTEIDDTLQRPVPRTQAVAAVGFGPFAGFSTLSVDPNDPNGGYFVAYTVQNFAPIASLFAQVRRFA